MKYFRVEGWGGSLVICPDQFITGQSELVLPLEVVYFKPGITLKSHSDRLENWSYFEFPIITAKGIYRWESYT